MARNLLLNLNNYFHSIAILVGTIIGVGLFTIPYVIDKAGILTLFIYLPLLGIVEYYLLKLYAEVALSTKKMHRIPGYVSRYFGEKYRFLALFVVMLSNYGSILAYIIIGGIFSHQLLFPFFGGSNFVYATILFAIESFIVLFGLKLIAKVEVFMTIALVVVIGLIIGRGWGYIDLANFSSVDFKNIFLPYGPIFFAVGGMNAVPEICRLLSGRKDKIASVLAWGTGISVFITLVFVTMIVGVTGSHTTPDTLTGLASVFGNGVVVFSLIFGILSIITSTLIATQSMREVYWWDFKMNKNWAWVFACGVPYIVYAVGIQDLTKVVSLTGAFTGGVLGIILIWLVIVVQKKAEQNSIVKTNINSAIAFIFSLLFVLGLVYEIMAS